MPSLVPPHMVSTPNNSRVSLNFNSLSENQPPANLGAQQGGDDDHAEEDGGQGVAEIVDEFCSRSQEEQERTLVEEIPEERTSTPRTTPRRTSLRRTTPSRRTSRRGISEVFLDQQHHSETFSIPLRCVYVSGRGVPKIKDVKRLRQKTKKRRW